MYLTFFLFWFPEFLGNSPLLKHLGEAGLLHDVSALLARARSRDEGNLRKIQSQAKGRFAGLSNVPNCNFRAMLFP